MASTPEIIRIRSSARMQRIVAARRAIAEANDEACELCGEPIDYEATPRSSPSWSMQHRISMKVDISLAYEPDNHGSAHLGCNALDGRTLANLPTGGSATEPQSIDW